MKFLLPEVAAAAAAAAAAVLLFLLPPAASYPETVDVYAETVSPEWHPVEEWSVRRENE